MTVYERYLNSPPRSLDERVNLLLEAIRQSVARRPGERADAANVRHMEEFFDFLRAHYPAERFRTEVQPIPRRLVRTTDRNFVVTVPGRSSDTLVLVAHYDTWAGLSRNAPGADDNGSGEEVLKQYLLLDLNRQAPPLTHVYLFSGSEECGTRGLVSQFALTAALSLAGWAVSSGQWAHLWTLAALVPLANYRFGVAGTKHWVQSLSPEEKRRIRAAIAVDSVGEGTLYILENEMGANFVRALFPYEGSESLNDLLEEGAHLHHIPFRRFLGGGTTDSVAFLEERGFFPGRPGAGSIPAGALITMGPGKCSPFIAGGKLHTAADTADRVYPRPLAEVLSVLDYAFQILEGGKRVASPRALSEHHYARLYRDGPELLLALKDAVEPNRRNINSIVHVEGDISDGCARLKARDVLWWGVETSLDRETRDFRPAAVRVDVETIELAEGPRFERAGGVLRRLFGLASAVLGRIESLLGRYSFLAMFAAALLVSWTSVLVFKGAISRFGLVARLVSDHFALASVALVALQILVVFRLFTRELPSWMDSAYTHENRACNLRSLRRAPR